MNISNAPSATQTSTNVWAAAIRRITGLGTSLGTAQGNIRTTIANGANVSLQPSAGSVFILNVLGIGLANVTWQLTMANLSNQDAYLTGASGAAITSLIVVNNSFFFNLINNGTVNGTYSTTQIGFTS